MAHKLLDGLVAEFNGAIKYTPMLQDHPDWTKQQCLDFARKWHSVAIQRLKVHGIEGWNSGIPYCRNIPSAANLKEAGR